MNNIEELKAAATAMRLSSTMRISDEAITFRRLFTPDCALALIAQLESAQKEPKETREESDIPTLRSEAASIIGLLTAEGHQTFSLDKVADFFDDVFRKFELAEAALSAANEKLLNPVKKLGHNFGKPMGWAVVTNDGMLNGGVHDTERCARSVADSKEYAGKHRVIPLVSGFVEGNVDAE